MKKILPLLFSCLSFFSFNAVAQTTTTCNANFTWNVSGQTVKFLPDVTEQSAYILNYWSFGDGHVSDSISPYNTYSSAGGVFVVTHYQIKKNPNGVQLCIDSVKKEITIQAVCVQPTFTYTINSTNYLSIKFTNTTTSFNANDSISWAFGDGAHSGDLSPTHVYANAGTYHICLLIKKRSTNSAINGCTREGCMDIVVAKPCNLQADFNFQKDPTTNKVYFVNASTPTDTTNITQWSFGDGAYSNDKNPVHTYSQTGTYTVCLKIKRNDTYAGAIYCADSICKTVEVAVPVCSITPDFTWIADATLSTKINFTNATSGLTTTDSVRWSFGDGTYSKDVNATHTYTLAGTYTVTMQVIRYTPGSIQVACEKTITKEIKVAANCNSITIDFGYINDSTNIHPYTYKFTNSTTTLNNTDSIRWSFGDGTYSRDVNPSHTFSQTGTYTVCLRIIKRDNNNQLTDCVKEICKTITVVDPCNFTPSYSWQQGGTTNKVYFSNTTSLTLSGAKQSWYFGDGTAADTSSNPIHEYAQYGKYYVCLRVAYGTTCVKYKCDSITVLAPVVPCDFTAGYTYVASTSNNKIINFTATSSLPSGTTATVNWFFGDTSTATVTGWTATHTYKLPGRYYVCARIQYGTNCVKYKCDSITVLDNVVPCNFVAGYTWAKDTANTQKINFTNTTTLPTPNAISSWSFGDGSATVTSTNATHVYTQPGRYYVCLTVTYGATCVKYKCDSITVVAPTTPCDFVPGYTWVKDTANNKKINFTNSTTLSTTTNVTTTWSFGDGTATVATWNAIHEYAQPGKYYVCLRIAYGTNCVKYKCDSVTVSVPPVPCTQLSLFTYTPSTVNHQLYYFTPANQSTDVQYTWTFGDGTGSHDVISNHQFANTQTYTVCLTAFKNANCAFTTCNEIRMIPPTNCDTIKVSYGYHPDQYMQNKIYLYSVSNVSLQQQTWTIVRIGANTNTAVTINQTNPLYAFTDTGYYNVCLKAVTANGCAKEYCNIIHITSLATVCELQTFPNPTTGQINVYVPMDNSEMIHAYIYNAQGVLVQQKDQQGFGGNNVVSFNSGSLPVGYYTIKLIYGNSVCFAKFQKL